jgi:hypothetical protein
MPVIQILSFKAAFNSYLIYSSSLESEKSSLQKSKCCNKPAEVLKAHTLITSPLILIQRLLK